MPGTPINCPMIITLNANPAIEINEIFTNFFIL